jgi:hypothetical protein
MENVPDWRTWLQGTQVIECCVNWRHFSRSVHTLSVLAFDHHFPSYPGQCSLFESYYPGVSPWQRNKRTWSDNLGATTWWWQILSSEFISDYNQLERNERSPMLSIFTPLQPRDAKRRDAIQASKVIKPCGACRGPFSLSSSCDLRTFILGQPFCVVISLHFFTSPSVSLSFKILSIFSVTPPRSSQTAPDLHVTQFGTSKRQLFISSRCREGCWVTRTSKGDIALLWSSILGYVISLCLIDDSCAYLISYIGLLVAVWWDQMDIHAAISS